jgi:hypothetical protein
MTWGRLARTVPLLLVHCAVSILIIVSVIEVYGVLAGIIHDLGTDNRIYLAGALASALVPSGALLFWVLKAISAQLSFPIGVLREICGTNNIRDRKS